MTRMPRILFIAMLMSVCGVTAASPAPAVTYESMLNMYFDDTSGLISIRDIDLAFAPDEQINAAVALVDSNNTVVESHRFYPDPRWRETVFARLNAGGAAEFQVTDPGIYNIVFIVDGKPVSRLPVRLDQASAGDDPFNPVKTYSYTGLWPLYAFITTHKTWKEESFPELNLWLGNNDLAPGKDTGRFRALLKNEGKVIAHSKETQGFIANRHYQDTRISLFHPHDRKTIPNAPPFLLNDWTRNDGEYELEVRRQSDDALIRRFDFTVEGNQIKPLAASQLGYEPAVDYVVPRVLKRGSNRYEFVEAIWLKRKD